MFQVYFLAGALAIGVICIVAYEVDQHVQDRRRREYEQGRRIRVEAGSCRNRSQAVDPDLDEAKGIEKKAKEESLRRRCARQDSNDSSDEDRSNEGRRFDRNDKRFDGTIAPHRPTSHRLDSSVVLAQAPTHNPWVSTRDDKNDNEQIFTRRSRANSIASSSGTEPLFGGSSDELGDGLGWVDVRKGHVDH